MKKLLLMLMLVIGVFGLTACTVETEMTINSDGTYTGTTIYYMGFEDLKYMMDILPSETFGMDAQSLEFIKNIKSEDEFDDLIKATGTEVDSKVINGKKVYANKDSAMPIEGTFTEEAGYTINSKCFEYKFNVKDYINSMIESYGIEDGDAQVISDLLNNIEMILTVHMPSEITSTNGTLSADKKTVTFNYNLRGNDITLYAYTKGGNKGSGTISINTGDNGYTTKKSLKISTSDKITSVTVNGEKVKASGTVSLGKDGVYNIKVVTDNGEQAFVVTKDAKKPKIKGVSNGTTYNKAVKIKFSDATSGIKSATLNGKAIKSGKKVKSAGKYTLVVTDNAGNKTTVEFEIKK